MLDFFFEYLGVASIPVAGGPPLELLLIRNLLDQRTTLRMLDIKIGEVTAVEGCAGVALPALVGAVSAFRKELY